MLDLFQALPGLLEPWIKQLAAAAGVFVVLFVPITNWLKERKASSPVTPPAPTPIVEALKPAMSAFGDVIMMDSLTQAIRANTRALEDLRHDICREVGDLSAEIADLRTVCRRAALGREDAPPALRPRRKAGSGSREPENGST